MPPLALTDSQLDAVYRCAGPLAPAVRPAFLELVAQGLASGGEVGWRPRLTAAMVVCGRWDALVPINHGAEGTLHAPAPVNLRTRGSRLCC